VDNFCTLTVYMTKVPKIFSLGMLDNFDKFAGIAAASPSMWFPGFVDYMKSNAIFIVMGELRETLSKSP